MTTTTPQEELKAVKARARKAAEKARAQIAKAKQEALIFARDADRAQERVKMAQKVAEEYKICYLRLLDMFEKQVKANTDVNESWLTALREADQLRIENARLRRQLREADRTMCNKSNSSKIWEICPN